MDRPNVLAEEVGFEPTVPFGTTVFKTAAFNHSAIPPHNRIRDVHTRGRRAVLPCGAFLP